MVSGELITKIVTEVIHVLASQEKLRPKLEIPVGVSARHVHLSEKDVGQLFGPGYRLTPRNELHPGQYAAEEAVTLIGPRNVLRNVRVLGPPRDRTQAELSVTDCIALGLEPVVRLSGDTLNTPGAVLVGPKGVVQLTNGVIVAQRHLHITPNQAQHWGLEDGQTVKLVATSDSRALVFDRVVVRVSPKALLELHIDTDEANAAALKTGDIVELRWQL